MLTLIRPVWGNLHLYFHAHTMSSRCSNALNYCTTGWWRGSIATWLHM